LRDMGGVASAVAEGARMADAGVGVGADAARRTDRPKAVGCFAGATVTVAAAAAAVGVLEEVDCGEVGVPQGWARADDGDTRARMASRVRVTCCSRPSTRSSSVKRGAMPAATHALRNAATFSPRWRSPGFGLGCKSAMPSLVSSLRRRKGGGGG